jgi:phage terminase small subunit
MGKLTGKQERFCKEYVIDFNATRSAKAAGYSTKTAMEMGYENLGKPQIQAEIARLTKKTTENLEVTAERVVAELAKMGLTKKDTLGDFTLDSKDKLKALEMLARHTGTFNNDESGKATINVNMGKKK